jgi:predicted Na+-dependent transporter
MAPLQAIRHFIETRFGLALVLACGLGLVLPGLPAVPNEASAVALAALMFVSSYKLQDGGFAAIRWRDVGLFWLLRYGLLPLALWYAATLVLPGYATEILLLSVVPAAVSSPAFSAIYGGVVAPAFAVVVLSQLLTPLLIPLQFMLAGAEQVSPSPGHLLRTLLLCIVLPMLAYALARRHAPSARFFYRQNKFFSIVLIMFVIALAISKQREVILASPAALLVPLAVAMGCYATYLLGAWWLAARRPRAERITYATCSVFNNAALAVSLGLLHFPPDVVLFVAAAEIGWALLPGLMKQFLQLQKP